MRSGSRGLKGGYQVWGVFSPRSGEGVLWIHQARWWLIEGLEPLQGRLQHERAVSPRRIRGRSWQSPSPRTARHTPASGMAQFGAAGAERQVGAGTSRRAQPLAVPCLAGYITLAFETPPGPALDSASADALISSSLIRAKPSASPLASAHAARGQSGGQAGGCPVGNVWPAAWASHAAATASSLAAHGAAGRLHEFIPSQLPGSSRTDAHCRW